MNQLNIPPEFLKIRREDGVSLESEGINDVALEPTAALRAIDALRGSLTGLSGGEIWRLNSEGRFVITNDIWDLEKSDYVNADVYLQESWNIAEKQVRKYQHLLDKFYVVLNF